MERLLASERTNAALGWGTFGVVLAAVAWTVLRGRVGWLLFGLGLAVVLLVPPLVRRSVAVMAPWPIAVLAATPFVVGVAGPPGPVSEIAGYAAAAAVALLVVVEIDAYTAVEMNRGFAIAFVVVTTVTAAGTWELLQWFWDLATGSSLVANNEAVMWRLLSATGTGVVAGAVFDRYISHQPGGGEVLPDGVDPGDADDQVDAAGDVVSAWLERLGLSTARQHLLVRGIQVLLAAILVVGVATLNVDVVFNAGIALVAIALPGLIERDYDVHVDVGLVLWIATAVVLHTLGTLFFYQTVWGWHNLAHAVSGSLVAGTGYAVVRTLEAHTRAVSFPPKFLLVFVVIVVFAMGVFWEILEFTLDQVSAAMGTEGVVLAQHGLTDTMSDLLANTVGALAVAAVATAYRSRPEETETVARGEEPSG